jgi:hypothetical protein
MTQLLPILLTGVASLVLIVAVSVRVTLYR